MRGIAWIITIGLIIWYFLRKHTVPCTTCGSSTPSVDAISTAPDSSPATDNNLNPRVSTMQIVTSHVTPPQAISATKNSHVKPMDILGISERINYYSQPALR